MNKKQHVLYSKIAELEHLLKSTPPKSAAYYKLLERIENLFTQLWELPPYTEEALY